MEDHDMELNEDERNRLNVTKDTDGSNTTSSETLRSLNGRHFYKDIHLQSPNGTCHIKNTLDYAICQAIASAWVRSTHPC